MQLLIMMQLLRTDTPCHDILTDGGGMPPDPGQHILTATCADKNERRQGSVGENSINTCTRYVPLDEKKDKVKTTEKKKPDGMLDTTRPRHQSVHQPPTAPPTPPPPREPTSAPFLQGKGALSYGLEGKRLYGPPEPYQSMISLNLDSVRPGRDDFFANLHGLRANVLMFHDHRLTTATCRPGFTAVSN